VSSRRPILHWLLLASLVVMWGSSFLFIKVALTSFSPEGLVAARLAIAAAALLGVQFATGRRLPRGGRHWAYIVAMAITGNVLPFWMISWGQQGIDSGLAGILMAVMPLTTILLAHFFVKGERLDGFRATGFALGFVGIVVLTGPEALLELRGQGTRLLSELAVLGGAVFYAINAIIARRRPKSDSLTVSTAVLLVATAMMLPITPGIKPVLVAEVTGLTGFAVLFLGLVSTALGTIVLFKLIAIAGPGFMSLTNYLIPPWAVLVGFVFLGEVPRWPTLLAMALILSGILIAERRGFRRARME
jgi:drug/metabolite transporter (DMT)-like permease